MRKYLSAPDVFGQTGLALAALLIILLGFAAPLKFAQSIDAKVLDATLQPAFHTCLKSEMDVQYYRSPLPKSQAEYQAETDRLKKAMKKATETCTTSIVTGAAQKIIGFLFAAAIVLLSGVSNIFNALKTRPERLKNKELCHLVDHAQAWSVLAVIAIVAGCAWGFAATLMPGNGITNTIPPLMFTLSGLGVYIACVVTAVLVALFGKARLTLEDEAPLPILEDPFTNALLEQNVDDAAPQARNTTNTEATATQSAD